MSEIAQLIIIRVVIFAGIMIFCFPFLLGYAYRCIEPVDFGISYNANSKQMDNENLYYSGRHYVGLGHFFKRFPRSQTSLIFSDSDPDRMYDSIQCRSMEGLKLDIHIFLSYKLTTSEKDEDKIKELISLYNRFEYDYEKFIVLMVHSVIRNVAAEYNAFEFFQQRGSIGIELFDTLQEYFEEYHIKLIQLYIINMEIPQLFDEAILKTEIVNQQIEEKTYLKQAKMIEGNTSVLEAQYDAQILILKAKAAAQKSLLEKQAIANSTKYVAEKQLEALKSLKDELELVEITDGVGNVVQTVADQLFQYIWIYQLKQMSNDVVLGLQQPYELNF